MIIWCISEFIVVVRYQYQLLVVYDIIVLVAISAVSYFRCQILVVSYSVVRYHSFQISQLSDISCQMLDYQLVLTSAVVEDISYYCILNHIDCLLIKDTITRGTGVIAWWCMSCILEGLLMVLSCGFQPWGTKVVLATYSVVSCQGYVRITTPH